MNSHILLAQHMDLDLLSVFGINIVDFYRELFQWAMVARWGIDLVLWLLIIAILTHPSWVRDQVCETFRLSFFEAYVLKMKFHRLPLKVTKPLQRLGIALSAMSPKKYQNTTLNWGLWSERSGKPHTLHYPCTWLTAMDIKDRNRPSFYPLAYALIVSRVSPINSELKFHFQ